MERTTSSSSVNTISSNLRGGAVVLIALTGGPSFANTADLRGRSRHSHHRPRSQFYRGSEQPAGTGATASSSLNHSPPPRRGRPSLETEHVSGQRIHYCGFSVPQQTTMSSRDPEAVHLRMFLTRIRRESVCGSIQKTLAGPHPPCCSIDCGQLCDRNIGGDET